MLVELVESRKLRYTGTTFPRSMNHRRQKVALRDSFTTKTATETPRMASTTRVRHVNSSKAQGDSEMLIQMLSWCSNHL